MSGTNSIDDIIERTAKRIHRERNAYAYAYENSFEEATEYITEYFHEASELHLLTPNFAELFIVHINNL